MYIRIEEHCFEASGYVSYEDGDVWQVDLLYLFVLHTCDGSVDTLALGRGYVLIRAPESMPWRLE